MVLCLLFFLSSHSSHFLAKEAEQGEGAPFQMTKQQQQLTGAVVWRCYSSNRWPVKDSAQQSHLHTFSMSSCIDFHACLGQGSSWPKAEVAADKQNEVRGCWDEIGAPSVKIKEL